MNAMGWEGFLDDMTKRVLLVEDENLIRMTLAETLEEAGYLVVAAGSGDEACALLSSPEEFHVLLTDIHMPGEADGIAVAQTFHRRHPNSPVVFMTGRPEALSRVGSLAPSEVLLRKPFGSVQMLTAIATLLIAS